MKKLCIVLVLTFPGIGYPQAWSGIISPTRAIDWSKAGTTIPTRNTNCATLGVAEQLPTFAQTSVTSTTINNAIINCPQGQAVFLNPGTYTLAQGITFGKTGGCGPNCNSVSNVTLRGAGADKTLIKFTGQAGCIGLQTDVCVAACNCSYDVGNLTIVNWTANYSPGTTSITLASASGITPGSTMIILDQLDETADTANDPRKGMIWNCDLTAAGGCASDSANSGNSGSSRNGNRTMQQQVLATACNGSTNPSACTGSSTTVTISPGIYAPNWNWDGARQPQAWWTSIPNITGDGIESLSMDHSGSTGSHVSGVFIMQCYQCYVKGIRDMSADRAHIWLYGSSHAVIRDSYFYKNQSNLSQSYGIEMDPGSSDNLIENNIFDSAVDSYPNSNGGGAGNVAAYNFAVATDFGTAGWFQGSDYDHAGGQYYFLREGNQGIGYTADNRHGTHQLDTLFRNYYPGWQRACPPQHEPTTAACNAQTAPIDLQASARYLNIIGNVLGTANGINIAGGTFSHTVYQTLAPTTTNCTNGSQVCAIYLLGWTGNNGTIGTNDLGSGFGFCAQATATDFSCPTHANSYDTLTVNTMMRWGNYDTVSNAVRFVSSEVPSGLPTYANAVPASQTLPASFYLSGKPSWWGTMPFPAIGPDVTGGNVSGLGGHLNNIPAEVCWANAGGVLETVTPISFNADACYAASVSTPVGSAASITATAGAAQTAAVNTGFATALAATVKDASDNLLSGVAVTFTAPASGASGTFADGLTTTTATTNGSGVATAPAFTANGMAGSYTVTATVAGVSTPATFTLTNTAGASLNGPSAPFTIPDRGMLSFITPGAASTTQNGYAVVQPSAGRTAPAGFAILGFRQNGILVTETSVLASPLIQAGRIYAEVNGPVNTGLAIANPNGPAANLSFSFTDSNGNSQNSGSTILAKGQIAVFLNQAPFTSQSSFTGSFTFTSSIPVSVIALRGLINERNEFLMTTLPVANLSAPSSTSTLVFPHFADGGGWATQIELVNPTDSILTGTVQFSDSSGNPAAVSVSGQSSSSFSYSIPGRSSRKLQTTGTGAFATTGSVSVVPTTNHAAPSGVGIFSFKSAGITVSEAGIPAVPAATAFRLYAEASGDFSDGVPGSIQTGIAVANTSSTPATITLELFKLDGSSTGLAGTMVVPGSGHAATFLNQISGLASLQTPFQGVLRVSSTASISVAGLRSRYNEHQDFLITTTPSVNEASVASIAPLYFSDLADGGGYTTQFILFSGQSGQSSSGSLQLFTPSGTPLNLTSQ